MLVKCSVTIFQHTRAGEMRTSGVTQWQKDNYPWLQQIKARWDPIPAMFSTTPVPFVRLTSLVCYHWRLDRVGYLDQRILQSLPPFDGIPDGSCEDAEGSQKRARSILKDDLQANSCSSVWTTYRRTLRYMVKLDKV